MVYIGAYGSQLSLSLSMIEYSTKDSQLHRAYSYLFFSARLFPTTLPIRVGIISHPSRHSRFKDFRHWLLSR